LVKELLCDTNPTPLLVDMLLVFSQLARAAPREQRTAAATAGGGTGGGVQGALAGMYAALAKSGLLPLLVKLLDHPDAGTSEVVELCLHVRGFTNALCFMLVAPLVASRDGMAAVGARGVTRDGCVAQW